MSFEEQGEIVQGAYIVGRHADGGAVLCCRLLHASCGSQLHRQVVVAVCRLWRCRHCRLAGCDGGVTFTHSAQQIAEVALCQGKVGPCRHGSAIMIQGAFVQPLFFQQRPQVVVGAGIFRVQSQRFQKGVLCGFILAVRCQRHANMEVHILPVGVGLIFGIIAERLFQKPCRKGMAAFYCKSVTQPERHVIGVVLLQQGFRLGDGFFDLVHPQPRIGTGIMPARFVRGVGPGFAVRKPITCQQQQCHCREFFSFTLFPRQPHAVESISRHQCHQSRNGVPRPCINKERQERQIVGKKQSIEKKQHVAGGNRRNRD